MFVNYAIKENSNLKNHLKVPFVHILSIFTTNTTTTKGNSPCQTTLTGSKSRRLYCMSAVHMSLCSKNMQVYNRLSSEDTFGNI